MAGQKSAAGRALAAARKHSTLDVSSMKSLSRVGATEPAKGRSDISDRVQKIARRRASFDSSWSAVPRKEITAEVIRELEEKGVLGEADKREKAFQRAAKRRASFASMHNVRQYCFVVVNSSYFSNCILFVILLNTVLICSQTFPALTEGHGWLLEVIDNIFLAIYIFELLLKLYALRVTYFDSGWNNLDFVLVMTSVTEYVIGWTLQGILANTGDSAAALEIFRILRVFKTFRAIRAFRALRALTFFRQLEILVTTLIASLPAMSSIFMIMMIFLIIFSILGVLLFEKVMPDRFGNCYLAAFTLFQVMTLDDWFSFVTQLRTDKTLSEGQSDPSVGMFFFLAIFIFCQALIFINLFIAVIVNNVESVSLQMAMEQEREQADKGVDPTALGIDPRLLSGTSLENSLRSAPKANAMSPFTAGGAEGSKSDTPEGTDLLGEQNSKGLASLQQLHGYEYFHPRDKELLKEYLMLLASADSQMERYSRQLKTMDDLVDIVEKADFLREGVIDIDAEGSINQEGKDAGHDDG